MALGYLNIFGFEIDIFGSKEAERATRYYEQEWKRYQELGETVNSYAQQLYTYRTEQAREVLFECERYINQLRHAPIEFEKSVSDLRIAIQIFDNVKQELDAAITNVEWEAVGVHASGVAAGVGVATLAPTAAMAIATTFGTASTGAAIAGLAGAAQTSAALAWLGGGALAVGGSGMAAGNALLALAGPVGWAIGGAAIVGGILMAGGENGEITGRAYHEAKKIHAQSNDLQLAAQKVSDLLALTRKHTEGIRDDLAWLEANAPASYSAFTDEQKNRLMALVNNVNSLSVLINKRLDDEVMTKPMTPEDKNYLQAEAEIALKVEQWGGKAFGEPLSPKPLLTHNGVGYYQVFKNNGRWRGVHWCPGLGAHVTQYDIRGKWQAMNWEHSFLGFPVADENPAFFLESVETRDHERVITRTSIGSISYFEGGAIAWITETRAIYVFKRTIRGKWLPVEHQGTRPGWLSMDDLERAVCEAAPDIYPHPNSFGAGKSAESPQTAEVAV